MTSEKKQEFTLKITSANKTQLVVIIYDMALAYLDEAVNAKKAEDKKAFLEAVDRGQKCVESLLSGLDFDYEISHALWHLYFYVIKILSRAIKNVDDNDICEAMRILTALRNSFEEVSKEDKSKPMMGNTQSVVAGITYGRNSLNEDLQNNGNRRGYFA